jgi:hypothetical protein
MHHHYRDIIDKCGRPLWWDEYAVPRYCAFAPDQCANIYADEVAYLEIACQNCGAQFSVAMSSSQLDRILRATIPGAIMPTLASEIEDITIHYGDPPNAGCCLAGPTMNCIDRRVLEFWRQNKLHEWERVAGLEGKLGE